MHTEAEAGVEVLSNLEDAPVAGKTSRITLALININTTHMTSNQNSMAYHAVCVEDLSIPPSIVIKGNTISITSWKRLVLILINPSRVIYISNGDHDNPHEPPQIESEGCDISHHALCSHQIDQAKELEDLKKLFYIYQHFQDSEKIHQIDTDSDALTTQEDSLYPYVNNDIEYGLFEDIVESYHLDSQIKDYFQCDPDCYTQTSQPTNDNHPNICTHDYQHIAQNIDNLSDPTQQNKLYSSEKNALSFIDDTDMQCNYSISAYTPDIPNINDTHTSLVPIHSAAHSQQKHAYRDTFSDAHIQYHEFDNKDLLTVKDKYTVLLQQELENPYWNLHDPIMTKSYQISKDMDIETMPHTIYFTGNPDTITKINQVPGIRKQNSYTHGRRHDHITFCGLKSH